MDRTLIDRTTTHSCPGLARDIAYFEGWNRSYFSCQHSDGSLVHIPVHYVQFSMICADCRRECTDASDVAEASCAYCGEVL